MTFIVESIHKGGIVHTPFHRRYDKPHSGDFVRWADGTIGRIWECGTGHVGPDEAQVCETPGSAFLLDDGRVDISGGPFRIIKLADLQPTSRTHVGEFWNWGNNRPAAHQGVTYLIARPLFDHRPGA